MAVCGPTRPSEGLSPLLFSCWNCCANFSISLRSQDGFRVASKLDSKNHITNLCLNRIAMNYLRSCLLHLISFLFYISFGFNIPCYSPCFSRPCHLCLGPVHRCGDPIKENPPCLFHISVTRFDEPKHILSCLRFHWSS